MVATANFRRQHAEILEIASQVSANLNLDSLGIRSEYVLGLIAKLAGKLTAHLSMEDKALYPKLYGHPDLKVQSTAKRFFDEMGGLAVVFTNYCGKWDTEEVIRDNADDFIQETKDLFVALSQRIDREDNELYPLADAGL